MKTLYMPLAILALTACTNQPISEPKEISKEQMAASQPLKNNEIKELNWNKWVSKYDKGRRSNTGWLSLAGLYWLNPGTNTIGSAKDNDHQLPKGMPLHLGKIEVNKDKITLINFSENTLVEGKNITNQLLEVNKTEVSFKNFTFYIIKREKNFAIRLQDAQSPKIAKFLGTKFYPYANEAAVSAKLIKNKKPKKLNISTVYGTIREADSAGILEFQYKGKKLHLEAVSYGKDSPMTLMFVDETGQETTYGAGRYLEVEWPKNGDTTIVDFNYAYNPPCAITSFATCPLPPRQNRLDVAIEAGELFDGH